MDSQHAARAHKHILVEAGHAHHFVRDDLPDRQDQVVPAVAQQLVHLRRPRVVQLALAHLAHKLAGDLAQRHNVVAPVMHPEEVARRGAEHRLDLVVGHRLVRA